MPYKDTYNRLKELVFNPFDAWNRIASEPADIRKMITVYLFQLVLAYLIAALLGNILFTNDITHSLLFKILRVFGTIAVLILFLIVSYVSVRKLMSKLEIPCIKKDLFKVIFYANMVIWFTAILAAILANYKMLVRFLYAFSLYGYFHFWTGSEAVLKPAAEKKRSFYAWSFVILAVLYTVLNALLHEAISTIVVTTEVFKL